MATDFPAYVCKNVEKGTSVEAYTPSQTAGETLIVGELWYYDTADGKAKRCGADPALIAGISEVVSEDARLITPDGKVPLRRLSPQAVVAFSSSTTPVEATHRGQSYGVARSTAGNWRLDISETTTAQFTVVDVDVNRGIFYCVPKAANLQFDGIAS